MIHHAEIRGDIAGNDEAKGSHGYFHVALIEVDGGIYRNVYTNEPQVAIDVWSKRRGDAPPTRLFLTIKTADDLGQALVETATRALL